MTQQTIKISCLANTPELRDQVIFAIFTANGTILKEWQIDTITNWHVEFYSFAELAVFVAVAPDASVIESDFLLDLDDA